MTTLADIAPLFDLDFRTTPAIRVALDAGPRARAPQSRAVLTLDELLVGAAEGLRALDAVACPVCSGAMLPVARAGRSAGGACRDCGTAMS